MKYLALTIALSLATAPAFAHDQAAHDARTAQHNIDSNRAAAAQASANQAKNEAAQAAAIAAGQDGNGAGIRAARNAASVQAHNDKVGALLAGCPTCH